MTTQEQYAVVTHNEENCPVCGDSHVLSKAHTARTKRSDSLYVYFIVIVLAAFCAAAIWLEWRKYS